MSRDSAPWRYMTKHLAIFAAKIVGIALLLSLIQHLTGWPDASVSAVMIGCIVGVILGDLIELKWRARDR